MYEALLYDVTIFIKKLTYMDVTTIPIDIGFAGIVRVDIVVRVPQARKSELKIEQLLLDLSPDNTN